MIPIFKYGKLTASSAGVESSFKKLKVVTFKDMDLLTNIDLFLERHIIFLHGNYLLRSSNYTQKQVTTFKKLYRLNKLMNCMKMTLLYKTTYKKLVLKPKLRFASYDLNNSLPKLKNGSKVTGLKIWNLKGYGKVVLSNTCAFDALVSIFMGSYCTSKRYSEEINCLENTNDFLSFASSIVKKGINPTTNKERAQII